MNFTEVVNKYFQDNIKKDPNYKYEKAFIYVRNILNEKINKKMLEFNKNIEYSYDKNGFPKLIHFTVKDKNNITNNIWRECIQEYTKMYPDYKIIIYDDNDIFNIVEYFDKKNLNILKNIKIGAILADVFRYLILYLRGGYYSDMDCFPCKRIDELSTIQYHGDSNNNIFLYNNDVSLPNDEYCFYDNPCNNCVLLKNNVLYKNTPQSICKCLGHNYINNNTKIIVCYEFDKTWNSKLIKNEGELWVDNNIGICQWFIGAKPQEKLFMLCYKKSLKNAITVNLSDKNTYHYNVINSTGPLFFTRIINKFLLTETDFKNKLAILPADYFCCGSGGTVPSTKNKFIQHKFTGSWLK